MKKTLLIFLLSICLTDVSAQYHKMLDTTNVWSYTTNLLPVRTPASTINCTYPYYSTNWHSKNYTNGDTVLNNKTYKKMYYDNPPCLFGFIREDSAAQKVYFLDNLLNPEVLLYDFSMQLNDSILINFLEAGYYESGYYHLDSVKQINIQAGLRRKFYLSIPGVPRPLQWIESVGSYTDVAYPYVWNQQGDGMFSWICNDEYKLVQLLTCFEHNKKVYYDSCMVDMAINNGCYQFIDSCTYGDICGSIKEYEQNLFSIAPNPSTGKITILNTSETQLERIIIHEVSGRLVMDQHYENSFSANSERSLDLNIPSGVYLITAETKRGRSTKKLVIR